MVVSPAVFTHNMLAHAGDVLMGIAVFIQSHSKNWETTELCHCSINAQPIREESKSVKHVKLHVNT